MAGYLDEKQLENYAICGARMILHTDTFSNFFEENPDVCYRALMVKYLFNNYFIQPLVDDHPCFLPVVKFQPRAKSWGGHLPMAE